MEEKICKEVAEQEFERWGEAMDLDFNVSAMLKEDSVEFERMKAKIVKALMRGSLIIDDCGRAVYTPTNPESGHKDPITFKERTGAMIMAIDRFKKNQQAAAGYAMMAELCGLPPKTFAGLVGFDIKVCEAMFALLME
jgi:hypothetical protein